MIDGGLSNLPALSERLRVDEPEYIVASGYDLLWLAEQLCAWPGRRIDPTRTMNDRFLRFSASQTMLAQAAEIARLQSAVITARQEKDMEIDPSVIDDPAGWILRRMDGRALYRTAVQALLDEAFRNGAKATCEALGVQYECAVQ